MGKTLTTETALAAGMAPFVGLLLGGGVAGKATRGHRHAEGPPRPGQVPAGRHRGESAATAR